MGDAALQVHPTGVKLLAGTEEVQDLPIEDILPSIEWRPGVVIAAACVVDPYALLHFSDGSAILLSGDPEEGWSLAHLAHCALFQDSYCNTSRCALASPAKHLGCLALHSSTTPDQ